MKKNKTLSINNSHSDEKSLLIQAIRQPEKKSLKIKKFVFCREQNVKIVSMYKTWRPPSLKYDGKYHYVEYYFLAPESLPEEILTMYPAWKPGKWTRFRIKDDGAGGINRIKDPGYAQSVVDNLLQELKDGYNPFQYAIDQLQEIKEAERTAEEAKKAIFSLEQASTLWLNSYDPVNRKSYSVPISLLKKYFTKNFTLEKSSWYQPIDRLTQEELEDFLEYTRIEKNWQRLTYNDKVLKLITFFNYCVREKIVIENAAAGLELLPKGATVKHIPFEDDIIPDVKKAILKVKYWGEYLHKFSEVIYYTCTRPVKETRQLKIADILWTRHSIMIPDERAKKGRGRFIYMVPELEALFKEMKLKDYPPEYYIFGKDGPPGPEPTEPWFYSEKFRKEVREPMNLSPKLTNYSWKHTRIIHLYLGGALIAAIQQLCGHASPSETEEYLSKGLGLQLQNVTHDVSRKF